MAQATPTIPVSEQSNQDWYRFEVNDILAGFNTSSVSGLSEIEAENRRDVYGPNVLFEATPRTGLSILLAQLRTVPVALLTVAAVISFLTGGHIDAAVIMGVVGINATIGYLTESQSEKIIYALKRRSEQVTWVKRSGQAQMVATASVVPGDLLILRSGSFVTTDARVIDSQNLTINEAALTGESSPVEKTTDALTAEEILLADRTNMAYKGTLVTAGQGMAIATATGSDTELGKIQQMVDAATAADTPLEGQLDILGSQLVFLCSAICALVFGIGVLRGYALLPMLKIAISLAVAAVPEGLPTIATTTLALGIREMRHRHILIRTLHAVEALGAIQTICLDKTGTITENKMVVAAVQTGIDGWPAKNGCLSGPETTAEPNTDLQSADLKNIEAELLMQVAVLCSDAQIEPQADGTLAIAGSPTETALIEMAIAADVDVVNLRHQFPLLVTYPRTQTHPVMTTVHLVTSAASNETHKTFIAVKGSPASVLSRCNRWQQGTTVLPLTADDRERIGLYNQQMASKALRVLGFAYRQEADSPVTTAEPAFENNLIWLGLAGLADPIRVGVSAFIKAFHQAGVKTVMITGDQSPTARAIAEKLQIGCQSQMTVIDATDLGNLSGQTGSAQFDQVDVFARVSPAHKLEIVKALQNTGQIVAMTGDGINDTPALKTANVGIAMGAGRGNGVHDVADVVIADDNLKTLIDALSRGRATYQNIRKSVHFLLSTNLSEIIVTTAITTVAIGSPMTVMQLLWLNLVTDVFPGLALALEPPETDVLTQPPRDPREPIIKAADFGRIGFESTMISLSALGAYGYGLWQYGVSLQAGTMLFMGLTIGQILHTLSCRSEKYSFWNTQNLPINPYVVVAIAFTLTLQALPMVIPALSSLLKLAPITLSDWLAVVIFALLPLLINEGSKNIFYRFKQ